MRREPIHLSIHLPIPLLLACFAILAGILSALPYAFADAEPVSDELILEIQPTRNRAYLHEAVPVTVTLLAGAVTLRDIQYPRLAAPAFHVGEFLPPRRSSVTRNGREYSAYEFATTVVPRSSGAVELGPAELRCEVLAPAAGAAAFFGGSETRSVMVHAQPVAMHALPMPVRGKPADFSGAVGRFALTRQVTPDMLRNGDTVTIHTRIEGVGNIDSFVCPSIALPGVHSYPPHIRRQTKRLTCEQVLVVETAASVAIPAARISFFDPVAERYRTLTSPPVTLNLIAAASQKARLPAPVASARAASPPAERWPQWKMHWGALIAGGIVLAGIGFLLARRRGKPVHMHALRPGLAEAEVAAALAANDSQRFHTAIFRLLQGAAGVGDQSVVALLQECDAVRYGRQPRTREQMTLTFGRLQAVITLLSKR